MRQWNISWDLISNYPGNKNNFILELLRFGIEHYYFYFGEDLLFCLQKTGVAMGAKFAPSLANLSMAFWENEAIYTLPKKE